MVFSVEEYRSRIASAVRSLRVLGGDYIITTPSPNLIYFTGLRIESYERITALIINADGDAVLIAPQLESLPEYLREFVDVILWNDSSGPDQAVERVSRELRIYGKIGFYEDSMRLSQLEFFREKLHPERIYLLSKISRDLRYRKSHEEILRIYEAVKSAEKILQEVYNLIVPGITERFLEAQIVNMIAGSGLEPSFKPIVAFGENTANPHHRSGDKVLSIGEPVLIDLGVVEEHGYISDLTRMYIVGTPSRELRDVFTSYSNCYNEVMRSISSGVKASELDLLARTCLADSGLGRYIMHRTGHGIGLEVHEPPYISMNSNDVLEKGVVFTIEPGVYIKGSFGVRVESNIAITDDGSVLELDKLSRDLIIF
ncbi:MAG: Xaa-Pro peptidase family protein [Sulfolobales archaeon]